MGVYPLDGSFDLEVDVWTLGGSPDKRDRPFHLLLRKIHQDVQCVFEARFHCQVGIILGDSTVNE